ncbi:MAG: hypothetical protein ABIF80_01095 [Patescibacteria group bacterium]
MKKFAKKLEANLPGKKDRSGQALLLSLLIMATITAAGIGFATLIISQIRAAENIDNAITATYGAESGLEKALHIVKTNRLSGASLSGTITEIEGLTDSPAFSKNGLSVEFDEDAISSTELNNKFSLSQDKSKQIDFYNPDDPFGATTGINALYLSWDNNPLPTNDLNYASGYGTGSEWVEVTWTGWNADGDSFENVEKVLLSSGDLAFDNPGGLCPADSYIQCTTIQLDPVGGAELLYYQVRIKALHADIDDIEIKALNAADELVNIPSRVYIKTIGKYGRTQQALNASLPWKISASGLFDYVIFSEEQIDKAPETNYQTSGTIEIERGIAISEANTSCGCSADFDNCSRYPTCFGSPNCTGPLGLGFEAEYWQSSLACNKNILADLGSDIRPSGWGTCNLYYLPGACSSGEEYAQIKKLITADDLPYNEGDYYVSMRALYNSNQNSEEFSVIIDDGSCNPDTTCQRIDVRDLYATMANPAVTEYKTCISQTKLHIEPNDTIIFEYRNGDENNSVDLDWYQFSSGIPPGVSERCDSDFTPLKIQMENGIERNKIINDQCTCIDSTCKEIGSDCLKIGWNPGTFDDLESPVVQCYRYSNETEFPSSGVGKWDVENRANGWGACLFNSDRWMRYVVPKGVSSGPYFISIRAGFTEDTGNIVKVEVYDGPAPKGKIVDTFISNDLWGSANTPANAFVECTFPNHVVLKFGYEIKLSVTNSDTYIDWFEISDTPPGYHSCFGSAIPYGVTP